MKKLNFILFVVLVGIICWSSYDVYQCHNKCQKIMDNTSKVCGEIVLSYMKDQEKLTNTLNTLPFVDYLNKVNIDQRREKPYDSVLVVNNYKGLNFHLIFSFLPDEMDKDFKATSNDLYGRALGASITRKPVTLEGFVGFDNGGRRCFFVNNILE